MKFFGKKYLICLLIGIGFSASVFAGGYIQRKVTIINYTEAEYVYQHEARLHDVPAVFYTIPAASIDSVSGELKSSTTSADSVNYTHWYSILNGRDINDVPLGSPMPISDTATVETEMNGNDVTFIIKLSPQGIVEKLARLEAKNSQLETKISHLQDVKIQQLEQDLNELTSSGSIEKAVHNEIKENNMVSEAVAEQLTPTTIADGVKKTLEETRLEHANDTSLPIGTFYVQGTEFNHSGYFNVSLAYNNGLLKCSNVGSGQYTVDMSTKNANELISQIMGAYVTDSKVRVDDAIQLQNNDIGQYCQIKSLSVLK